MLSAVSNFSEFLQTLVIHIVSDVLGEYFAVGFPKSLVCTRVHGAESGDTCFSITTALNITPEFFSTINPNLNCSNIFVSEWLCINGTIS